MTLRTCIECGEISEAERCDEHKLNTRGDKASAYSRGYDHQWRKLSERARRLQPFCSDCGATEDLQTDHLPSAWARKAKGLPIRMKDVDVVCAPCNVARGPARPGAERGSALRRERVGAIPDHGG